MTGSVIADAAEWRGQDGFSNCVMSIGLDGRLHISVHDRDKPGFTASFAAERRADIAAFIKGES